MKTTRRDFLCLSAMACAWLLTGCQQPTVEERAVSWQPQQGSSGPASESDLMLNAALDDDAVLREGIRIPQNFELPLEGSTGFAGAAVMPLYEKPDETSAVLRRLAAGDMFYIRQESGSYWQVCLLDGTVGWLENELCMINLPDVLPSIVYENPNARHPSSERAERTLKALLDKSYMMACSTTSVSDGMNLLCPSTTLWQKKLARLKKVRCRRAIV